MYNSTRSAFISDKFSSVFLEALTNNETRILFDLKLLTTSLNNCLLSEQFQPKEEVRALGGSGTKVTWSGLISFTILQNFSEGYPSILNSILFSFFCIVCESKDRSEYLTCLSSDLGWTVMPLAPY